MINYNEDDQNAKAAGAVIERMKREIKPDDKLFFYGAGLRSEEIIQMQKEGLDFLREPDAFLVSDKERNSPERKLLKGIPVYLFEESRELIKDAYIVVATMDVYHEDIRKKLSGIQCKSIFFITDDMEHLLTRKFARQYLRKYGYETDFLPFIKDDCARKEMYEGRVKMYRVMCLHDEHLSQPIKQYDWIDNLQVGAALTEKRIAGLCDDKGVNISEKNPYYNELTGLYWVWKNTDIPYSGICHYRRQFESDMVLKPILEGRADVVLPIPFVVGSSLEDYYLYCGEKEYYMEMLAVIRKDFPEYYECAQWCKSHIIFIPNNICIARRDILEDYCSFLFGVVDEVERRMNSYKGKKQTRCWLSEHISTIYFMNHLRDYRTVFAKLNRYW